MLHAMDVDLQVLLLGMPMQIKLTPEMTPNKQKDGAEQSALYSNLHACRFC